MVREGSPSIEGLRELARFAGRLEAPGLEFGSWVDSTKGADGAWSMPYVRYGEVADELRVALGGAGLIRMGFDWRAWLATERGAELRDHPERIAGATFEELGAVVTSIVRGDRFTEGNLLAAFERGHLAAIARRAGTLADERSA